MTRNILYHQAAAHKAENPEAKALALRSGMECGASFGEMLDLVHNVSIFMCVFSVAERT